jgi:putative ABC transport system permease protein
MFLIDLMISSIQNILRYPLRTFLTTLGIIIGVASVIAMMGFSLGAERLIIEDAKKLGGTNMISFQRTEWYQVDSRWKPVPPRYNLTLEDIKSFEKKCPSVAVGIPYLWGYARFQSRNGNAYDGVFGGTDRTQRDHISGPEALGRFIDEEDVKKARKVCVLGYDVAQTLFGDKNPVGEEVRITVLSNPGSGVCERFKVIGMMGYRGKSIRFGWNLDNTSFIPVSVVQRYFWGTPFVYYGWAKTTSMEANNKAQEEIKAVVMEKFKLKGNILHFWLPGTEGLDFFNKIIFVTKVILISIASVSLLVGGAGIMILMLVAVNERTREIGILRAVGAKKRDIVLQFLTEACIICLVGSVVGVGLGIFLGKGLVWAATKFILTWIKWESVIPISWIIISIGFYTFIGLFFGLYPAIRASHLSPIEALRVE